MEGPQVLPATINLPSLIDLKDYVNRVDRGLQIPWCLEQDFARSESGGKKTALRVCRGGLSEFCPENGGDRYSIDIYIKALLQVKRLSYSPEVSGPSVLMIPLKFVETVFELPELKDYSKESWTVFQTFLLKPSSRNETTTMLDMLPSFPNEGSIVCCTGTDESHIIMNAIRRTLDEVTGKFQMKIDVYDSNPYNAIGGQEAWNRRILVLSYISVFSHIKAKGIENQNYPGEKWQQELIAIAFKGCSFPDRMTTCQLGGSCWLHCSYHLMNHIMGPSSLTPPLNEVEQLLFGGLVNLHLLRTGTICTNYSQFLFKEAETMREWRKCLHVGIKKKLDIVKKDDTFFFRVVKEIRGTCKTTSPPTYILESKNAIKKFFEQVVEPLCSYPKICKEECFHFWISFFTSKIIMRLNEMPDDPTFTVVEPGDGILWYDAKVHDPISWSQVQACYNKNSIVETKTPMNRLTVFPVLRGNSLAIAVFNLSFKHDGSGLKRTLLIIDSESTFTIEERTNLLKYIFEEKIQKSIQDCQSLFLQDITVQYVRFSKPKVWQRECCSNRENDGKPCQLWEVASNLSVLYVFSRFSYVHYTQCIPNSDGKIGGKLFDCDCIERLGAFENQVAVITEIAPFSFSLALKEYFEE